MTAPLTYLQVHLLFIIPPILVLGWLAYRREQTWWGSRPFSGLAIMIVLAVVYTTPWTNHLIPADVWWYGEGAVIGRIWYTPIEEYLFFVLQPILTAFWLFQIPRVDDRSLWIPTHHRLIGGLAGLAIGAVGLFLTRGTATYYLGWLLAWAGPILAIQWSFGLTYLWQLRRHWLIAVGVPTLYLWAVDWFAISLGVWVISDVHTVGLSLFGLPIEEALFFLVTNVFLVQGIVLYMWLLDRIHEVPTTAQVLDRSIDTDGR